MNKRSLSDSDFCSNKRNKVNLHTYDSEFTPPQKKRNIQSLLIEDIKCSYCGEFLYQHSSQDKAECAWSSIYNELMDNTSKLNLNEKYDK